MLYSKLFAGLWWYILPTTKYQTFWVIYCCHSNNAIAKHILHPEKTTPYPGNILFLLSPAWTGERNVSWERSHTVVFREWENVEVYTPKTFNPNAPPPPPSSPCTLLFPFSSDRQYTLGHILPRSHPWLLAPFPVLLLALHCFWGSKKKFKRKQHMTNKKRFLSWI